MPSSKRLRQRSSGDDPDDFAHGQDRADPDRTERFRFGAIGRAILQRDFLQSATAAAISRARAGCRGTQVRNTRVTSATAHRSVDRSLEHGRVWHLGRHQRHVLAIAKGRDRLVHCSAAPAPPLIRHPIRAGLAQNEHLRRRNSSHELASVSADARPSQFKPIEAIFPKRYALDTVGSRMSRSGRS